MACCFSASLFSNPLPRALLTWLLFLGVWVPWRVGAQDVPLQRPAAPSYDLVALRVEFQPDTTRFTTGDGTFDGVLFGDSLQPSIDPLPHDAGYFEAHLAFLEDYVASVSDGQTQVTTHLVPEIVRVSQEMGAYSPTGFDSDGDEERAKLVALVQEAWATASQVSDFDLSGFDPARTAFMIFHAGVGRDVELLGTTLDKTPLDLPSISFSERELRRLGGDGITFNGFPVAQTMFMPRTESRPGFNFIDDTAFLLELSINGLLAASFFNYLGVPDLFSTETGDAVIGPFGLMDPLGIFAYNGLFAPEPTAWTKYYLGWVTPQDLTGDGPETVTLQAAGLAGGNAVARASISAAEYFLIENRNRDPEGDGLILRVWQQGEIVEQRVPIIDDTFGRFGVDGFIGGVVVGVDNYDFALPGIDADDIQYEGGILIWHVDERVLAEKLETGGVNNDPERRAVDLEEADSAQDLDASGSLGAPFDFFYSGNEVGVELTPGVVIQFYENRFGPETIPDSDTNEGGPSFIVLEDFSAPGTEMTFTYRREAAKGVTPLPAFEALELDGPFQVGGSVYFGPANVSSSSILAFDAGTEGANARSLVIVEAETGRADLRFRDGLTRPFVTGSGVSYFYRNVQDQGVTRFPLTTGTPMPDAQVIEVPGALSGMQPSSPVVVVAEGGQDVEYAIWEDDTEAALTRLSVASSLRPDVISTELNRSVSLAASRSGQVIVAAPLGAQFLDGSQTWSYTNEGDVLLGQAMFGTDQSGTVGVVPVISSGELLMLRADQSVVRVDVGRSVAFANEAAGPLAAFPVLVDLDDDGRLDVVTTYGQYLVAFSQNGALVKDFPLPLPAASVAQPLVAELSDSGNWSILVTATNGEIYAYDMGREGTLVDGFPLAVGARAQSTPLLQDRNLYAIAAEGTVKAWELEALGAIWWGQLYGNAQNHSFVLLDDDPNPQPTPQPAGLIVEAETYNWPNPIRGGQTVLRCMTTEDASVRITIINAAGSLIDEVELELKGGAPTEHQWQSDAASGLYYARVTATSTTGQTATKLIKMAIIR